MKHKLFSILAAGLMTLLTGVAATSADAAVIQITEFGQVVSYTDEQFLTGNGGALLGTVGGYANDPGFLYSSTLDRYVQITELGQIVSYTYDQFLTGNGGAILGTVGGYANDPGFLYSSTLDRYVQITELGQIVSYTYDQFLTGNGGAILGTVGGYANDRGFLYVPDGSGGTPVPAPPTAMLLAFALPLLALVRRTRGRRGRVGPPSDHIKLHII
jgi:hypothetical protein